MTHLLLCLSLIYFSPLFLTELSTQNNFQLSVNYGTGLLRKPLWLQMCSQITPLCARERQQAGGAHSLPQGHQPLGHVFGAPPPRELIPDVASPSLGNECSLFFFGLVVPPSLVKRSSSVWMSSGKHQVQVREGTTSAFSQIFMGSCGSTAWDVKCGTGLTETASFSIKPVWFSFCCHTGVVSS